MPARRAIVYITLKVFSNRAASHLGLQTRAAGLPKNKKAIAEVHCAGAPTCAYSERITFGGAELLSSMARAAAAQEGIQREKHGTNEHHNV